MVDTFIQSGALRATLNHVQLIELNTVRPLLPHALDQINRLELAAAEAAIRQQQSQQNNSTNQSFSLNTTY